MDRSVVRLIRTAADAVDPTCLPAVALPDRLLMAEPTFYDVAYVENPHMEEHVGRVDRFLARRQWRALVRTYQRLGVRVMVIPGQPFLPDYVFAANQVLPVPPGLFGPGPGAIRSIMKSAHREPEVGHVVAALEAQGLAVEELDRYEVARFEGTGDGIWHPGRALLYGGVGERSCEDAWIRIGAMTGAAVALLNLVDPRFYHLDTCLSVIDERTAVIVPHAFDTDALGVLRRHFPRLLEISVDDAMKMFCNGHSPDGRRYVVQAGAAAAADLGALGIEVVEVDTSEFVKSGGSVFCMKLHYWSP